MIKVIDALCGAGKSTAIYKKMRDNPDNLYVYITPFLSEIEERIPEELPELDFHTPQNKNGKGKVSDFQTLVQRQCNIASTHVLFSMLTSVIVDLLIEYKYTLIIDEVVDCVGLLPDEYKESDIKALTEGEFVIVEEGSRGKLTWNEDKYPEHDGRYSLIRSLCNLDMLYTYNGTFLMWEMSPKLLKGLSDVYVLSYLFRGSDMFSWLTLNGIEMEYLSHEELGLRPESELKQLARENIILVQNRTLNSMKQTETALSNRWFQNAKKDVTDKYKGMIRSFVVQEKITKGQMFWTTHKSHAKKLAGNGYSIGISDKDKNKEGKSFLPCNIRATNDYADYKYCVYAMNRFKNPIEVNYMEANGGKVDQDAFAVGELLQFAYRGTARKGEPMKLFILSKRMERLFKEWLDE